MRFSLLLAAMFAASSAASAEAQQRCEQQEFTVYFSSGSASLSREARAIVADAARHSIMCERRRVIVMGHTDAAEAEDYELRDLRIDRSRSVAAALRRNDVASEAIDLQTSAFLAVRTHDRKRLREPLNRRVTINFEE